MRVGVVSDTHDDLDLARAAVETFEERGVEAAIHCGDVVAPFTAEVFDRDFDFYAVRGNNDGEWNLQGAIESFGTYLGEAGELELDGLDVAVYHGTAEPLVDALLACGEYDYVLRGHTHERVHEERGETTHLNPGGLPFPGAPEPPAAVVIDTDTDEVTFHELG